VKLTVIESPYAGEVDLNIEYARACVADSLMRGEAPIASHLLYTQPGILDDIEPDQRVRGLQAGHCWLRVAQLCALYCDRGISPGMELAANVARQAGVPIEKRFLFA
jgi:hypothetical protein